MSSVICSIELEPGRKFPGSNPSGRLKSQALARLTSTPMLLFLCHILLFLWREFKSWTWHSGEWWSNRNLFTMLRVMWHGSPHPSVWDQEDHSVRFSCSVMSNSLWPHGLQHARPPCPSPTPGVYPNSCPLSRWCHPTISAIPFSHLRSFPASGSFQVSQFFKSGGQSIGISASTSVLPMGHLSCSPTQSWISGGPNKWFLWWHNAKISYKSIISHIL